MHVFRLDKNTNCRYLNIDLKLDLKIKLCPRFSLTIICILDNIFKIAETKLKSIEINTIILFMFIYLLIETERSNTIIKS